VTLGDTVAIWGQGVIGLLALQAAIASGADRVIAVDVLDGRLAWARQFGAAHTINAAAEDPVSRILELTAGRGCEVVIEASGLAQVAARAPKTCGERGRLVLLGMYASEIKFDYWDLYTKELDILSSRGAGPKEPSVSWFKWTWAQTYREALELIGAGRIRVRLMITHRLPIEQIREGYKCLSEQPGETLKVMLNW
jgi:threonine dehydrogenase-like Zn-dependent dehydrogenase